jgi:hypothetical protein
VYIINTGYHACILVVYSLVFVFVDVDVLAFCGFCLHAAVFLVVDATGDDQHGLVTGQ